MRRIYEDNHYLLVQTPGQPAEALNEARAEADITPADLPARLACCE